MLFLSEQEMWQSVTLEDVMDAIEDADVYKRQAKYSPFPPRSQAI